MIRMDGKIPLSEIFTRIRVFLSLHHARASGERTYPIRTKEMKGWVMGKFLRRK